jgi:hypothetical protein
MSSKTRNTIAAQDATDHEMLVFDIADAMLEGAAGSVKERAGNITLAFCSGLDTCPA